jgi:hypothetical protein
LGEDFLSRPPLRSGPISTPATSAIVIVDQELQALIALCELANDSTAATSDSKKCAPNATKIAGKTRLQLTRMLTQVH